jgi:hypothetical protein
MGVAGQRRALAALCQGNDTYRIGGWVDPRANLDRYEKSCPYRVSRVGIA